MDLLYSPYCRVTLTTTILISAFVIKERAFVIKKNIDLLLKKYGIFDICYFSKVCPNSHSNLMMSTDDTIELVGELKNINYFDFVSGFLCTLQYSSTIETIYIVC